MIDFLSCSRIGVISEPLITPNDVSTKRGNDDMMTATKLPYDDIMDKIFSETSHHTIISVSDIIPSFCN